jgi:hypothetical protein
MSTAIASCRSLSAGLWVRLPSGTGGTCVCISKRGDTYLRTLFVHGFDGHSWTDLICLATRNPRAVTVFHRSSAYLSMFGVDFIAKKFDNR